MLKDKGTIFHIAGLTGYFGRCYYNMHPALFRDFYSCNGFKLSYLEFVQFVFQIHFFLKRKHDEFVQWSEKEIFLKSVMDSKLQIGTMFHKHIVSIPNDVVIACVAIREKRLQF